MTLTMRVARGAALSLGLLAMTQPIQAAAPKVAGKYASMSWHICQTVIHTPKSNVSRVTNQISVPGIGGIATSTNTFVSALTPQSDTFSKPGGGTGQAITSLGPTTNSAISDVQPTSTVNFLTVVNTANISAVTAVEPIWTAGSNAAGMMSLSIGVLTFPSTPTSSGTASGTNVEVLGHSMRNDNPANNTPITRHTNNFTNATFSLTATTFTVGTEVSDIAAGDFDPQTGVAKTLYLLRRPKTNEYCIDGTTLTKQ